MACRVDYVQTVYDDNRTKFVHPVSLTRGAKRTMYYWIHYRHSGIELADMLYPRKQKSVKKQASPNFKPDGKSIEERFKNINQRT